VVVGAHALHSAQVSLHELFFSLVFVSWVYV
jgi:low temperature requirement protein LtrA